MELLPGFIKRKKEISDFYRGSLEGVGDISFQEVHPDVDCNMWLFTIKTEKQKEVLKVLNDNQMQSRPFWVPMNQLPMFRKDVFFQHNDRSDFIYKRCLSIPCSTNITDAELQGVVDRIKTVF
jgi:perosamine synthetase